MGLVQCGEGLWQTEVSWEEILPPDDVWGPAASSTLEYFQPVACSPNLYLKPHKPVSHFLKQIMPRTPGLFLWMILGYRVGSEEWVEQRQTWEWGSQALS